MIFVSSSQTGGMVSQIIQPRQHSGRDRATVLIVEDDESSRRALRRLLSTCGYRARAFASAEEALSALNEGSMPPIALIDLELPGMNGLDLISRLENLDPTVHAILITASDSETLLGHLQGRDVTYLRKPLDFERLLTILSDQRSAS
jgi:DNA-binding NtrC family response regulator